MKTTRFKFRASEVLLPSSEMLNAKCSKANNIRKKDAAEELYDQKDGLRKYSNPSKQLLSAWDKC